MFSCLFDCIGVIRITVHSFDRHLLEFSFASHLRTDVEESFLDVAVLVPTVGRADLDRYFGGRYKCKWEETKNGKAK